MESSKRQPKETAKLIEARENGWLSDSDSESVASEEFREASALGLPTRKSRADDEDRESDRSWRTSDDESASSDTDAKAQDDKLESDAAEELTDDDDNGLGAAAAEGENADGPDNDWAEVRSFQERQQQSTSKQTQRQKAQTEQRANAGRSTELTDKRAPKSTKPATGVASTSKQPVKKRKATPSKAAAVKRSHLSRLGRKPPTLPQFLAFFDTEINRNERDRLSIVQIGCVVCDINGNVISEFSR